MRIILIYLNQKQDSSSGQNNSSKSVILYNSQEVHQFFWNAFTTFQTLQHHSCPPPPLEVRAIPGIGQRFAILEAGETAQADPDWYRSLAWNVTKNLGWGLLGEVGWSYLMEIELESVLESANPCF